MRTLVISVVAVMLLLVALLAAQTFALREIEAAITADPAIEASAVSRLVGPGSIGVRIEDLRLAEAGIEVTAGRVDLFTTLPAINRLRARIPQGAQVAVNGRLLTLTPASTEASLRLAPLHGLRPDQARLEAVAPLVDGHLALDLLRMRVERLPERLAGTPRGADAGYAVDTDLRGLSLAAMAPGQLAGTADLTGRALVWLGSGRGNSRQGNSRQGSPGQQAPPVLQGLRFEAMQIGLDGIRAVVNGQLAADATGRAEGTLLIDTNDLPGLVRQAAALGLLPPAVAQLTTTILANLAEGAPPDLSPDLSSGLPPDGQSACPAPPVDTYAPLPSADWKRLTLDFHDGRACLGPMPIGPAPQMQIR